MLFLKLGLKGIAVARNALLGAAGSLIVISGFWLLDIQSDLAGFVATMIVAATIPISRELYRFRRTIPGQRHE